MRKYEEKKYLFENIKDHIYPWVKEELRDSKAQNGKNISEKDTPIVSFINGLSIIFVIKRDEDVYEVLKDNMLPPAPGLSFPVGTAHISPDFFCLSQVHSRYRHCPLPAP